MAPPVGLFYMHKFDIGPPVVYFFCCYSSLGFYGLKLCVICICFVQIHATLKFQKYIFTTQFSVAMQLRNVQKNSKQEGKICLVSNDAVTLSPIISEHKFDFYSVDFRSKGLIKNKIKCPRLLSSIFIFPPPLFFFFLLMKAAFTSSALEKSSLKKKENVKCCTHLNNIR